MHSHVISTGLRSLRRCLHNSPDVPFRFPSPAIASTAVISAAMLASLFSGTTARAESDLDFTRDVQPILAARCYSCHGPDVAESGLRLTDFESATIECESGEFAIVPGDADAGELIGRITTTDEFSRMPPEGEPLDEEEVEILRRWIDSGAEFKPHWAFTPLTEPPIPTVDNAAWSQHPIDAFVFEKLSAKGLAPAPQANRATLLRRLSYGLTGLPPTRDEMEAFEQDQGPDAWQRQIDRLLASPHHGEAWARHWLDVVRYGETNSFERDNPKPNAWKYRDYVIRALNADMPYDQFVRQQVAGDELDDVTTESLTATGFYRLGIWDDEPADPLQAKFDEFDDLVTTTSQGLMGLTINCARCHDHKIDPIPQKDYYALVAFLADVTPYGQRSDGISNNQIDVSPAELVREYADLERQRRHLAESMLQIEQESITRMSAPDQRATEGPEKKRQRVLDRNMSKVTDPETLVRYDGLKRERAVVEQAIEELPSRSTVLGLAETTAQPEQTFVLARGNPNSPTDPVQPAFPAVYAEATPTIPTPMADAQSAGRRRVLADWLTQDDNFLVARVIVNRIWQFHFGRGIVRSSNNFGRLGTPPTHPELLDYLAVKFVREGWSLKRMHRFILTSRTYQMASAAVDTVEQSNPDLERVDTPVDNLFVEGQSIDPENDLYWRFDPRRLTAEEARDSMMVVAGQLNHRLHGPSMYPKLSAEVLAGQSRPGEGWEDSSEADRHRRSIYIHIKRSLITPFLAAFDFPDPDLTCEARFQTLGPNQALTLLNSDFANQLAEEIVRQFDASDLSNGEFAEEVVDRVLRRSIDDQEQQAAVALMDDLKAAGLDVPTARRLYALSVMNWNEFLFLD